MRRVRTILKTYPDDDHDSKLEYLQDLHLQLVRDLMAERQSTQNLVNLLTSTEQAMKKLEEQHIVKDLRLASQDEMLGWSWRQNNMVINNIYKLEEQIKLLGAVPITSPIANDNDSHTPNEHDVCGKAKEQNPQSSTSPDAMSSRQLSTQQDDAGCPSIDLKEVRRKSLRLQEEQLARRQEGNIARAKRLMNQARTRQEVFPPPAMVVYQKEVREDDTTHNMKDWWFSEQNRSEPSGGITQPRLPQNNDNTVDIQENGGRGYRSEALTSTHDNTMCDENEDLIKHREENKERCELCDQLADPNNKCVGCRITLCEICLDIGCPCTTPARRISDADPDQMSKTPMSNSVGPTSTFKNLNSHNPNLQFGTSNLTLHVSEPAAASSADPSDSLNLSLIHISEPTRPY